MVPTTYLTIGGYTFIGMGVPERINGGGGHQLVVHKFPGGNRVIDAMGSDDAPITFKGRFRAADGRDPMTDVLLLDAMRRAGRVVQLTYWNQSVQVVIRSFTWSFQRFYEVPYHLECEVLSNPAQAPFTPALTKDGAVGGDLSQAATRTAISIAASAYIGPPVSTFAQSAPIAGATPATVSAVQTSITQATTGLGSLTGAADIPAGAPGGIVAGGNPTTMAAGITGQAQTMTDGAAAQSATPFLQRANINLSAAGGEGMG